MVSSRFIFAFSKVDNYFKPLFLFVLFVITLSIIGSLPSYVSLLTGDSGAFSGDRLWKLTYALRGTLFGMIAFIPIIIVVKQKTFGAALDSCAELWARNAKSAAAFVIISTLLLLVPAALQIITDYRFPNYLGWERQTIRFISSLYKVSAGTLIMCSMVVFCRTVIDPEEPTTTEVEEV